MRHLSFVAAMLFAATAANGQTATEETVTLDSEEKRIVRAQYHASEAVSLGGRAAGGWRLYAGAAIDAEHIDLTMRNVRGVVRFRADWHRVHEVLARAERESSSAKRP